MYYFFYFLSEDLTMGWGNLLLICVFCSYVSPLQRRVKYNHAGTGNEGFPKINPPICAFCTIMKHYWVLPFKVVGYFSAKVRTTAQS